MDFEDLVYLYEGMKAKHGEEAYADISEIFDRAKEIHLKDWQRNPTTKGDHEQSWRAFKGKNFEKLVLYIISDKIEELGLKVIDGNYLERSEGENLSEEEEMVKRNLLVDFGGYSFLPDVDLVVYHPKSLKVIAVISSKITLRERIAQTGYWKLKLLQNGVTKHIKVFFVTPDEDGTLTKKNPMKKGRAIVESDLDGSYVMTKAEVEESAKVRKFDKFISDLRKYINGR